MQSLKVSLLLSAAQQVQDWRGIWTNSALEQMVLVWMLQTISKFEVCTRNPLPLACDCWAAALLCTWTLVLVTPRLASETTGSSVGIVNSWKHEHPQNITGGCKRSLTGMIVTRSSYLNRWLRL